MAAGVSRRRRSGEWSSSAVWITAAVLALTACHSSTPSAGPSNPSTAPPSSTPSGAVAGSDALSSEVSSIRQALESVVSSGGFPGAVVVVRRGGESRTLAVGRADVATRTPMTAADRFRIASVTKSMAAAVALRLVAQGRLRLSDTVEQWEPGLLAHGRDITIAELLGQTSGLPSFQNTVGFSHMHGSPPPRSLVALVAHAPLMSRPGTRSYYSNTNYVLLGMILAKAAHEPLPRLMQRELFGPFGLHHTTMSEPGPRTRPLAHGYDHGHDVTFGSGDITWIGAAGGAVSTVGDMARFFDELFGGRIVPPSLLAKMRAQRPETNHSDVAFSGYGLGVATLPTHCGPVYGHSGFDNGFFTDAWTTRDGNRSFALAANATLTEQNVSALDVLLEEALCSP